MSRLRKFMVASLGMPLLAGGLVLGSALPAFAKDTPPVVYNGGQAVAQNPGRSFTPANGYGYAVTTPSGQVNLIAPPGAEITNMITTAVPNGAG